MLFYSFIKTTLNSCVLPFLFIKLAQCKLNSDPAKDQQFIIFSVSPASSKPLLPVHCLISIAWYLLWTNLWPGPSLIASNAATDMTVHAHKFKHTGNPNVTAVVWPYSTVEGKSFSPELSGINRCRFSWNYITFHSIAWQREAQMDLMTEIVEISWKVSTLPCDCFWEINYNNNYSSLTQTRLS